MSDYCRFAHEQQIMDCWHVIDDINTLAEAVCEKNLTPDQISNILIGLSALYGLKFEKLFGTFEQSIKTD